MSLICSYEDRMERNSRRKKQIMHFMRGELYTTIRVLSEYLRTQSPTNVYPAMDSLVDDRLLRVETVEFISRAVRFYVLTYHGATQDADADTRIKVHKGAIPLTTLPHTIDVQRVRASGNFLGWKSERWLPGRGLKKDNPLRWSLYPDAVATVQRSTGSQIRVAIEVERTRKTPQRYRGIIQRHNDNMDKGRYGYVMYYCPTVRDQRALQAMLERSGSPDLKRFGVYPYPFKEIK